MDFIIKHFKELSITELYRGQGTVAEHVEDRGAWCTAVHEFAKGWTGPSD